MSVVKPIRFRIGFAGSGALLLGMAWLLALLVFAPAPAAAQTFLPDDPIGIDPDRLDVPQPSEVSPSDVGDFVKNTFLSPGDYSGPARNANTLEEVPQSSWYAWRHYHDRMSIEALKRGPNPDTLAGPSKEGPWTVVASKEEGKSVGMQIEDARGDRYLLKFDPPGYLELSTGAEVVSTKLLYALGYHVPQNYAVRFRLDRLVPGEEVGLSKEEIRELLTKAARYEDGTYRALASKFLEGKKPLGPFRYYGVRPDDANDVFPHESRRELRGLRVFSAWINNIDARSINSLDMFVEVGGRSFVRHHLIDFGSTLGGGPTGPKKYWQGYEYELDVEPMLKRAFSLGFAGSWWLSIDYPGYPSIGHIEAEHFDPTKWKPLYPNPAFQRMDDADAFWAARQVMFFSDEEIRAIVSTGRYTDPEAEAYLAETLMRRRDRIGRAYLGYGGGLDRFHVSGGQLTFEDLLVRYGLVSDRPRREVTWRTFDNATGRAGKVVGQVTTRRPVLSIPDGEASFLVAQIRTRSGGRTDAYLRRRGRIHEVVGLSRTGTTPIEPVETSRQRTAQVD